MRISDVLLCLATMVLSHGAQCIANVSSSLLGFARPPLQHGHTRDSEPSRRNTHLRLDLSQPTQARSSASTTDGPQPEPMNGPETAADGFSSDLVNNSPATSNELSSTADSTPSTSMTNAKSTTSSNSLPGSHTVRVFSVVGSFTAITSAKAPSIPNTAATTFSTSRPSMSVTVVLCCFVGGGIAVILFDRAHRDVARLGRPTDGAASHRTLTAAPDQSVLTIA
jgi:hypothetical protein